MKSGLLAGLIAISLTFAAAEAAAAPGAEKPLRGVTSVNAMPQNNRQAARHFSAVLRYGPGTASGCQSLSDNSTAICLLLALHVMQLSQKRVTEIRL
ncbi:MAG TPA: hypothetical protein VKR31_12180 [Rhizomicrobium sp.]|nr:hypothetical protein [Rhizomicrobium sp.]